MDAADAAEAAVPQPTAAALRENIQHLRERKGRYEQVRAALEASGESQISLTDPDSRAMPKSPKVDVGYNVQTAEMRLSALAYTIKRVLHILGIPTLLATVA